MKPSEVTDSADLISCGRSFDSCGALTQTIRHFQFVEQIRDLRPSRLPSHDPFDFRNESQMISSNRIISFSLLKSICSRFILKVQVLHGWM